MFVFEYGLYIEDGPGLDVCETEASECKQQQCVTDEEAHYNHLLFYCRGALFY